MNKLAFCFAAAFLTAASAQDLPEGASPTDSATSPAAAEQAGPGVNQVPGKAPLDVSKMSFGPDAVSRVITYHQESFQKCYEDALAEKGKQVVEGKLVTSWTITTEGLVKSAKVTKKGTTLKDPKLHDCVVAVLSAMSFPRPADNREYPIEYPIKLKAIR